MSDEKSTEALRDAIGSFVGERLRTFEDRVRPLEQECIRALGGPLDLAGGGAPPPEFSRAWYAREILFAIECVRGHLSANNLGLAVSEAFVVGGLATEAEARLHWPEVQKWNARMRHLRKIGKKGGSRRTAEADRLRCDVKEAALAYRAKHPYNRRTRSQRRMARDIARQLGENPNTVRGHLRRLKIR